MPLTHDQLTVIARELAHKHHRRVYFFINRAHLVERSQLQFLMMQHYTVAEERYAIPVYTFNNHLYLHTDPLSPLGDGCKVGVPSASGCHYAPAPH